MNRPSTESHSPGRVGFVSLGCAKATVDSERILTELRAQGYEMSGTYDDADLVTFGVNRGDLFGYSGDDGWVDPVPKIGIGKRLSRELEDDSVTHVYSLASPTCTRENRATEMFSPIEAAICCTMSPMVPSNCSGRMYTWS